MDKPDKVAESEFAESEIPTTSIGDEPSMGRQSWIEVLVDPKTLQGLMTCGGALLVLGLVTWLWAIGVFENKLVVAASLGAANVGLLAIGLSGARFSRYQTASKAITMLACLVMPLNLWFYDAQGLITLDQGGHLWVPALVCCALYVLVARLLADPIFVNAIVGGVTMTGLLLLADHQVERFWEIMAPSSFLVILGIVCIHIERAFPPEEGPFSRANFGRAFFRAGHVVMGLGLIVLLVGRVVGRLYEPFLSGWDWVTLPEVATQANLKLVAIALALGAAYSYVYSQLVVQAKGRYLASAMLTLAWSAIMLLDLLQIALTIELLMLVVSISGLLASGTLYLAKQTEGQDTNLGPFTAFAQSLRQASGSWANVLNSATLVFGLIAYYQARIAPLHFNVSHGFSGLLVAAGLIGGVACWLAAHSSKIAGSPAKARWQVQAGVVLSWLAIDALLMGLGIELTAVVLVLEMVVALGFGLASLQASSDTSRSYLALVSEVLAAVLLAVGLGGTIGLIHGVTLAHSHLSLTIFFAAAAGCFGLSSRVTERTMPAVFAAGSLCAAAWQLFLLLGVTQYVFILSTTFIGLVCLVIGRFAHDGAASPTKFANLSRWTGRLCISYGSVATLLIALARLLSSEANWPLLGLLVAQATAGGVAGLLAKDSTWRRHFWLLATVQLLMALLMVNALSVFSFWQRGEILLTFAGLVALSVGYLGWYRETDGEDSMVSFNLALGSLLSAVPLTLGLLVQRFDNHVADWGWVLIHEAGVLSVGLLLLGAGVLCRIRWSTIVGGATLMIYIVSLIGLIHVPEKLQTTAIYMMVGGGVFFGTAVLLSVYRDRLLAIPQRIQNGEGVFRVLKWR